MSHKEPVKPTQEPGPPTPNPEGQTYRPDGAEPKGGDHRALADNCCPVCLKSLRYTQDPVMSWPGCGHKVHLMCLASYSKEMKRVTKDIRCPHETFDPRRLAPEPPLPPEDDSRPFGELPEVGAPVVQPLIPAERRSISNEVVPFGPLPTGLMQEFHPA